MVNGIILKVIKERVKNRITTTIHAKWELYDGKKTVCLRITSLKPDQAPGSALQEEEHLDASLDVLRSSIGTTPTDEAIVTPSEGATNAGTSSVILT